MALVTDPITVTGYDDELYPYLPLPERVPLHWARTQTCLGISLGTLGQRESETGRLEEAVSAHREALEEYTRERVPLDWAMTQNNLGSTLQTLGEREIGTGRLEEAVSAYQAALEERTRERVPMKWAMTPGLAAVMNSRSVPTPAASPAESRLAISRCTASRRCRR